MRRPVVHLVLILALLALAVPTGALAQQPWKSEVRQEGADTASVVALELLAEGITAPVALIESPDDSGRLFIVDQIGVIWILTADGTRLEQPFLDLREQVVELNPDYDERGLLGLAFHPNYADNGRFFVYYSAPLSDEGPADFSHTNVLAEFSVSANDPNQADPASERVLLQIDWPYRNHNGGTIAFGPADGYLYLSIGDGGNRDDEGRGHVEDWYADNAGGNGQDIEQNLFGSILRLDVDSGDPYAVPSDNPFVGEAGLDEVYAYGFRNPYRFSFDLILDHRLLVGDAGQALWEEVSQVTSGGNYGWNVKEGTHCFDAEDPENPPADCPDVVGAGHPREGDPLIDPVIEFPNARQEGGLGSVVVGGHIYRGGQLPLLYGRYVFGVWSRGSIEVEGERQRLPGAIFAATPQDEGLWEFEQLVINGSPDGQLQHFLLGFGRDLDGEVYLLTTDEAGPTGSTGKVYKLVQPPASGAGLTADITCTDQTVTIVLRNRGIEVSRVQVPRDQAEMFCPAE